ncbi:hypothetical protein [Bradyrhizobium australafricanum]|uniref:hypothetical protein n=1 Tax=Bradyrhizobium australafricanum TaxID=2821406 RepID=UPI001CE37987|nr:hypothetical protein [Bradyrhizobium australafricanum]MCA6105290.1 hypothetical protein [Bradyrhizobium australafricanum]
MTDSTDNITPDIGPASIDLTGIYMTAVQLAAHFKSTPANDRPLDGTSQLSMREHFRRRGSLACDRTARMEPLA